MSSAVLSNTVSEQYINNSLHLARKYARIFVRGHYLFEKRTVFRERGSRTTEL